ncbi:autotransporter-associated beta strand repeat-containing protein, partial [Polynucleobacter sp. 80A-SIGWE]|uniref:autotransporter-associated beta strand repeat-containing protein n=1 Tax=Polynucleobacter sp. 80A-SIGWE TaxID=2689100 RepID=UPI001C0B21E1
LAITNATGLGTTAAGTTIASGATLDLQNVAVLTEAITINGGTLKVSTGSSSVSGTITLSADSFIYVDTSSDLTLAGVISGTGGLTFSGGGTLSLDAANLFSGQMIVNDSLLIIRDSTALGSTSGGTVINGGSAELLLSPGLSVAGEDLTINGSFLSTQSGLGSIWSGNVSLAANSTISATGALEISGVISSTGAYGFTKTGSGTLTLSNANTYTGTTTISAGTLKAGNAAALGPSTGAGAVSITSGAVLDLNGQALTNSGTLTIRGTGISSGGALINSSSTAASYSGLVALGAASSIVGGSGT